ncbi:MAG: hypothetical protein F4Y70_01085 [Chloroflexi bacterium]|nr:hypothetical protein [Chloroflexota bacterium]MCY3582231.1 hypothetical protein [Chloroflexota bacterium]MXX82056.1 hypothetical protein [Chloroflexota bacterium]MYC54657.1 hypothetical protein [Chloroflexota bacterium]MYE78473.1 hypothetical protein [Chloroflexota bacterium]
MATASRGQINYATLTPTLSVAEELASHVKDIDARSQAAAKELARRLEGSGVSAYSVHPGWVRSNFGADVLPGFLRGLMNLGLRPFSGMLGIMNPYEGAQTSLHCLLDADAPQHNGAYFSQNSVLYPNKEHRPGGWPMASPNPQAHDAEVARKLYGLSLELVGLNGK